jgi:hypothetical protein
MTGTSCWRLCTTYRALAASLTFRSCPPASPGSRHTWSPEFRLPTSASQVRRSATSGASSTLLTRYDCSWIRRRRLPTRERAADSCLACTSYARTRFQAFLADFPSSARGRQAQHLHLGTASARIWRSPLPGDESCADSGAHCDRNAPGAEIRDTLHRQSGFSLQRLSELSAVNLVFQVLRLIQREEQDALAVASYNRSWPTRTRRSWHCIRRHVGSRTARTAAAWTEYRGQPYHAGLAMVTRHHIQELFCRVNSGLW